MKKFYLEFDFDGDEISDVFWGEDYGDMIYWAKLRYGQECEDYLVSINGRKV